ncbi:hypothetical protein BJ878DRAFT_577462 [Calycina marina]|uniref:Uncharacterized protein n=1 Tax=Calycina marina TaxID=1763456 RepID=A0A9P7YYL6_9HELO|nr:hypothetical protein BJ878DRAFT_577462 [Calycina marina]
MAPSTQSEATGCWLAPKDVISIANLTRMEGDGRSRESTLALWRLDVLEMLVYKDRNPFRKQPYEVMTERFKLPVGKRQLQRKLRKHTKAGRKFKCTFVKKAVSTKNRGNREAYGWEHGDKSVNNFWPTRSSPTRLISTLANRLFEMY